MGDEEWGTAGPDQAVPLSPSPSPKKPSLCLAQAVPMRVEEV